MRIAIAAWAALTLPLTLSAQDTSVPDGLAAIELERSRTCVDILARVEALDEQLQPLATRAQRLIDVAEAIALEDDRALEALDDADSVEARVRAWFLQDQELAQRYVATLAQELVDQRAAAREEIKGIVTEAVNDIQTRADSMITSTGDLSTRAAPCDGAIFVRSAVLEACASSSGDICEAASGTPPEGKVYRFVDTPESVWDVTEFRPWTAPTPLRPNQMGQLDGARTIGYARTGNVIVSVAFSPILQTRSEIPAEELARMQATNDSLGFTATHPDVMFAPGLGLRATLPRALAGESSYILHFGSVEDPQVLWSGASDTGNPLAGTIALGAGQVGLLQAGEPITLTALRSTGPDSEAVFSIELTTVNEARAVQALAGYMAGQLDQDLATMLQPRGSD